MKTHFDSEVTMDSPLALGSHSGDCTHPCSPKHTSSKVSGDQASAGLPAASAAETEALSKNPGLLTLLLENSSR